MMLHVYSGVDLAWAPSAHQATLSLPLPAGQRRENKMERN